MLLVKNFRQYKIFKWVIVLSLSGLGQGVHPPIGFFLYSFLYIFFKISIHYVYLVIRYGSAYQINKKDDYFLTCKDQKFFHKIIHLLPVY